MNCSAASRIPEKLRALLTTVFSGWWGYALLFAIVFAETGLLVGFFLPGDSLLFTVGVVAGAGDLNILLIDVALIAAASLAMLWPICLDTAPAMPSSIVPIHGCFAAST